MNQVNVGENTYNGFRFCGQLVVTKNGVRLEPKESQRIYNHSPDGFECGYLGSGPSQLALAILLAEGLESSRAFELHQEFKQKVISNLPTGDWALTSNEIRLAVRL